MEKTKRHGDAITRLEKEKKSYEEEILQIKEEIKNDEQDSPFKTRLLQNRLQETEQAIIMVEATLEEQKKILNELKSSQDKNQQTIKEK